ncbi:hypothetical protein O6H91_13G070500 [Diphasiastrum complanatum]|uniref:Uncharacterized protein n=1 Tax=Diphasiastrum complanatum TaxID=34168 RepID=A0ACC2BWZ1_DIPCM|nr:hypothetical protein O6H91_13G070500 [Diphasiastrum complanatum]
MARTFAALEVETRCKLPSWKLVMTVAFAGRENALVRQLRKTGFYAGHQTLTELQAFCEKDYNNSCPKLHEFCFTDNNEVLWLGDTIRKTHGTFRMESMKGSEDGQILPGTLSLETRGTSFRNGKPEASPKLLSAINRLKFKLSRQIHGGRSSCLKSLNTKKPGIKPLINCDVRISRKKTTFKELDNIQVSSSKHQQASSLASSVSEVHTVTQEAEFARDISRATNSESLQESKNGSMDEGVSTSSVGIAAPITQWNEPFQFLAWAFKRPRTKVPQRLLLSFLGTKNKVTRASARYIEC